MMMLVLSNPVLSMNASTRKLGKSTLLNKYLAKSLKKILSCGICKKKTNISVKISVNHSRESLTDR
jgi:hypothetical protein